MLTSRRIQYLVKEGVIPKPERGLYPLVGAIQGYIHYLQNKERQGAKRLTEDARLRGAQADLRVLELAKARGDVVSQDAVGKVLEEVIGIVCTQIDALPPRMAVDCTGRTAPQVKKLFENECHTIRQGLFEGLGKLVARVERRARPRKAATPKAARSVGGRESHPTGGERRAGTVS